jgi:hypothetical protein
MSEVEQLKTRIDKSGPEGILTKFVRDDYEPAGGLMIRQLVESGDYVTRRAPMNSFDSEWRIFKSGFEPY